MSICSRCGMTFSCAVAEGANDAPCWCMALPPLVAVPPEGAGPQAGESACWCPACLRDELARRGEAGSLRRGHG